MENTKRYRLEKFVEQIKAICSNLHIPIVEINDLDEIKKRPVLSLIVLNEDKVYLESHAVYSPQEMTEKEAIGRGLTLINAEDFYIDNNKLWVGDIKKIFTDYTVTQEEKHGRLVWCGTPYRSKLTEFYVDLNNPLMTANYSIAVLDKLDREKSLRIFKGFSKQPSIGITTDEQSRMVQKDLANIVSKISTNSTPSV